MSRRVSSAVLPKGVQEGARSAYLRFGAATAPLRMTPRSSWSARHARARPRLQGPRRAPADRQAAGEQGCALLRPELPARMELVPRPLPLRLTSAMARRARPVQAFEASGYYLFHPLVPQRMAADLPQVKLVATPARPCGTGLLGVEARVGSRLRDAAPRRGARPGGHRPRRGPRHAAAGPVCGAARPCGTSRTGRARVRHRSCAATSNTSRGSSCTSLSRRLLRRAGPGVRPAHRLPRPGPLHAGQAFPQQNARPSAPMDKAAVRAGWSSTTGRSTPSSRTLLGVRSPGRRP